MATGSPINGGVLCDLRRLRRMEQSDLANAACVVDPGCGLTREDVSAYERQAKDPTARKLDAIIRALDQAMRLSDAEVRALIRTPTLDAALARIAANGNGADTDRSQALKVIFSGLAGAALAPLAGLTEALERAVRHGDRPIDSKLISAHEDIADALASVHRTNRPDDLVDPVTKHADTLLRLLDRLMPSPVRRRLEVITVGSCAQAGLLAFNVGDRTAAQKRLAVARQVAEDSGDDTLRAHTLGIGSILYSSMPTGGRAGDTRRAVALLGAAVRHDGGLAWVRWWLATELAADGDERGFFQAVKDAQRLTGKAGHQDGRGFLARRFVFGAELTNQNMGVGLVRVGRVEEAINALEASLITASPAGGVIALADMAAARVLQGEPGQACHELGRALDLALDAGYAMGVQRIIGVRARFPAEWANLACVGELDERLRLPA